MSFNCACLYTDKTFIGWHYQDNSSKELKLFYILFCHLMKLLLLSALKRISVNPVTHLVSEICILKACEWIYILSKLVASVCTDSILPYQVLGDKYLPEKFIIILTNKQHY